MTAIEKIIKDAQDEGLEFLLIGGQAINLHGYGRMTFDFDFLVKIQDVPQWKPIIEGYGWKVYYEHKAFVQFRQGPEVDVDLMLVDNSTFDKLSISSQKENLGEVEVSIPSPLHIIAMKLHALKSQHRYPKDYLDILELMRLHKLHIDTPEFQIVFERYAPDYVRERLKRDAQSLFNHE